MASVGDFVFCIDVVGEGDFAAVGGGDGGVGDCPVSCVGDGAGGGGLDVEVVELEVDQWGVWVGAYREGPFGSGGLDVPDMDIAKVGKTLLLGDWGRQGDPVGWDGFGVGAGGQGGVAVGGVPVHGHGDGGRYADEGEVVDADIGGVAAAHLGGLEEDSVGDARFGGDVPGLDVMEAARGLGTDGDGGGSVVDDGVVDLDVVGGAVDAEAVGVAAGF